MKKRRNKTYLLKRTAESCKPTEESKKRHLAKRAKPGQKWPWSERGTARDAWIHAKKQPCHPTFPCCLLVGSEVLESWRSCKGAQFSQLSQTAVHLPGHCCAVKLPNTT
jgi:hypothetical protein